MRIPLTTVHSYLALAKYEPLIVSVKLASDEKLEILFKIKFNFFFATIKNIVTSEKENDKIKVARKPIKNHEAF